MPCTPGGNCTPDQPLRTGLLYLLSYRGMYIRPEVYFSTKKGTIRAMTRREKIKFVVVRSIGNFLLLFALYGVVATFGPAVMHEVQFRIMQARGVEFNVANVPCHSCEGRNLSKENVDPRTHSGIFDIREDDIKKNDKKEQVDEPSFADILAGNKEQVLIPKDTDFSIVIPKIGASAKILPNVDPGNPSEFLPKLQEGIAHAKGSVFPGMNGNTYLFAHSVDNWWHVGQYNAIFYLLKDLSPNDEIIIFFEGRRYDYVVTQSYIAESTDTTFLVRAHEKDKQLILQTCWPPGTTWKRLFVVAKPKVVVSH